MSIGDTAASAPLAFEFGPAIDELASALVIFQDKVNAVAKTKEAKVKMTNGGEYKYAYADLADVIASTREARTAAGLAVVQMATGDGNAITVVTTVLHKSGQWMRGLLTLRPADAKPQTIGSLITYMRRYSYSAALGICTEADDDGNAANGHDASFGKRGAEGKAPAQAAASATPAVGKTEPTTKIAPSTAKASEIKHDGNFISDAQLKKLHATRPEAGGQYCTDGGKDEDDARSLWRTKVLGIYRDQKDQRITSSKQLSRDQASHLIDRLVKYIAKTNATVEARDARTDLGVIIPIREPGSDDEVVEDKPTP